MEKFKKIFILAGIGVVVILIGLLVFKGFSRPKQGETVKKSVPTPVPTPTPTPKPIPHGKQTFSVSSGKKTGPQFLKGAIDPYDPSMGSRQTFSVSVIGTKPVTTVSLTLVTDTKSRTIAMKSNDGTYSGSWIVDDTYFYTYLATFTANDGTEENKVELTLR